MTHNCHLNGLMTCFLLDVVQLHDLLSPRTTCAALVESKYQSLIDGEPLIFSICALKPCGYINLPPTMTTIVLSLRQLPRWIKPSKILQKFNISYSPPFEQRHSPSMRVFVTVMTAIASIQKVGTLQPFHSNYNI